MVMKWIVLILLGPADGDGDDGGDDYGDDDVVVEE